MPLLTNRTDFNSPAGSSALLRSYQKAQFWRRLILAAFFTVFVATILYTIPWLPYGLTEEDYNHQVQFMVILMLMAVCLGFAAVYLRDIGNRVEQTMLTWNTVNDGLSDLRRREYFFDRIVLECSRAALTHQPFTIVALRLTVPQSTDSEKIARSIKALEPVVREYDCLSSLGPHEIAVLAHGIGQDEAPVLANNLAQLVTEAFPEIPVKDDEVISGYAVFDVDANDAGALIGIARERLMRNRQKAVEVEVEEAGDAVA
jgi:GGDEF domain-containing protein